MLLSSLLKTCFLIFFFLYVFCCCASIGCRLFFEYYWHRNQGNETVNETLRFVRFKYLLLFCTLTTINNLFVRDAQLCVRIFTFFRFSFFWFHYSKQLDNKSFVGKVRIEKGQMSTFFHVINQSKRYSERGRQKERDREMEEIIFCDKNYSNRVESDWAPLLLCGKYMKYILIIKNNYPFRCTHSFVNVNVFFIYQCAVSEKKEVQMHTILLLSSSLFWKISSN